MSALKLISSKYFNNSSILNVEFMGIPTENENLNLNFSKIKGSVRLQQQKVKTPEDIKLKVLEYLNCTLP